VLGKLFEEDAFNIKGICGSSAGAMNSAMAVYGFYMNGNQGAIDLLKAFWIRISVQSRDNYDKVENENAASFSEEINQEFYSMVENVKTI
jgi:predicted acylesterase/phospholipase RssA